MKKIILAAFLGATLGVFTAVKLTGPVLAKIILTKPMFMNNLTYLEIYLTA